MCNGMEIYLIGWYSDDIWFFKIVLVGVVSLFYNICKFVVKDEVYMVNGFDVVESIFWNLIISYELL